MKKFKGFTLLELIIVMAILAILMTAIIQLFKPIRDTYVDATLYENQRTSQNGMIRYITESVRFSTDLGMYTMDKVSNAGGAIEQFTQAYLKANGVSDTDAANTSLYTVTRDEIQKKAEVIIIDNANYPSKPYVFKNRTHIGRILRRKLTGNALTSGIEPAGTAEVSDSSEWRLAMGAAYYGDRDYTIAFGITQDPPTAEVPGKGDPTDGIKITVSSLIDSRSNGIKGNNAVSVNGLVLCKNQSDTISKGIFDTVNYNNAASTAMGTKVYIVYINDKIDVVP